MEPYLIVAATSDILEGLDDLIAAAGVSPAGCILIRGSGDGLDPSTVAALVRAAQAHGIAALVEDDPTLARDCGADGLHLTSSTAIETCYDAARRELGDEAIIGIDAGASRHSAMVLAEAGASYVSFSGEASLDLTQWWAEVMEVPVVALGCRTAADVERAAFTGAEFVAVEAQDPAQLRAMAVAFASKDAK